MVQREDMGPVLLLAEVAVMDMVTITVHHLQVVTETVMADTDPVLDPREVVMDTEATIMVPHLQDVEVMDLVLSLQDTEDMDMDIITDPQDHQVITDMEVTIMVHQTVMEDMEDTTTVHHVQEDTAVMDPVLILQEVTEDMGITTDLHAQEDMDIIMEVVMEDAEDPDPAGATDHHAHSHRIMVDTTITTAEDLHRQGVTIITDVITMVAAIHHTIMDIIITFHHAHHLHSGHHVHHRSGHHTVADTVTIIIADIVHSPHKLLILITVCIMYIYLSSKRE